MAISFVFKLLGFLVVFNVVGWPLVGVLFLTHGAQAWNGVWILLGVDAVTVAAIVFIVVSEAARLPALIRAIHSGLSRRGTGPRCNRKLGFLHLGPNSEPIQCPNCGILKDFGKKESPG